MWEMAQNSMSLFFKGKLFKDRGMVYRQLAIGIIVTAIIFIIIAFVTKSIVLAALLAGLVGGALQPYLFKDLRYQ